MNYVNKLRRVCLRLCVISLCLINCTNLFGPELPQGAVKYQPLPSYPAWYSEMATCLNASGDFTKISWYTAGEFTFWWDGGAREVHGLWIAPHNIVIASWLVEDKRLIKHEMGHDILQIPGHPENLIECSKL